MGEKIALTGLSASEITDELKISPSFRGKQIFSWIGKGAESFEEMTNLPAASVRNFPRRQTSAAPA